MGRDRRRKYVQHGARSQNRLSYIDVTTQVQRGEKPTPPKHDDISVTALDDPDETHADVAIGETAIEELSDITEENLVEASDVEGGDTFMSPPPLPISNSQGPVIAAVISPPSFDPLIRQTSSSSVPIEQSQFVINPTLGPPSFSPVSPGAQSDSAIPMNGMIQHQWSNDQASFTRPDLYTPENNVAIGIAATPLTSVLQSSGSASALRGLPEGFSDEACLHLREACLLRHFTKNLAPWFEISDRDRHYSTVVPQRAIYCPVLLYAIFTASARHLTRVWEKNNRPKPVESEGIPLPGVDDHTAIHYHNICINHLIEISNDPSQSYNEDALTAATILRFYEQIDTPLTGEDAETYLNVVRAVVETQQDESFYSIRKIHGPLRDLDPFVATHVSLRHSACLIALLQEIWSVLLYRRPIQLPISPSNDFELLNDPPPADDFIWANRIYVWTADVLRFCFGGLEIRPLSSSNNSLNNPSPSLNVNSKSRVDHWNNLKKFETTWKIQQPASYKPIYQLPSSDGRVLPEIWHNLEVQVLAIQHVEIASLLLSVYDPRLPRLGLGAMSAHRNLAAQIRKATLKICGLAMSHKSCQPLMVTAAVAISMCGEYFAESEQREQNAIVEFLERLETEHACPTGGVIVALREAWNGDD